jgi:hypothetical protein
MPLNLIADRTVKGKIYPSLARFQAIPFTPEWRQFHLHYPNTIPLRLQEYFQGHGLELNIYQYHDPWPKQIFYPIAFSWFNFAIDYISLVPAQIQSAIRENRVKILFYYHEGDNPLRIKQRIDFLIDQHCLPSNCYVFISSNSAADSLPQFVAFQDSELWYWHRNQNVDATAIHSNARSKQFTVLNRLHKWWRAAIMADLDRSGILEHSHWSYCENFTDHDSEQDCPIELDSIPGLRNAVKDFLNDAPYFVDDLTQDQRNDHSQIVEYLFSDSYCNIVLETMFDYDQSGGVLLSEKTFKPIKNGQLFFIAGGAGSLKLLRSMGYRTFDTWLDNTYDSQSNNTQRWIMLRNSIQQAHKQGIKQLYDLAREDLEYNQKLFLAHKHNRLSTLIDKIYDKSC